MDAKFYVIWGMHRAGTSLLAAALGVFGVKPCGSLLPGDIYNPKGYFETMELISLNESMLSELGQRWYSLGHIGEEQVERLVRAGYLERAIGFLRNQAQSSSTILLKDPRMCRLGGLWNRAFAALDIAPYSIVVWRNPRGVARSLRKRAENLRFPTPVLDESYSLMLWLKYTLSALEYTRLWPRVLIRYEKFIRNPKKQLEEIGSALGIVPNAGALRKFCAEFVDQKLNHYAQMDMESATLPKIKALCELLASSVDLQCPEISEDAFEPTPEEKLLCSLLDKANRQIRENAATIGALHSEIVALHKP